MASSLFGNQKIPQNTLRVNGMFQQVGKIKQMLGASGNPNAVVNQLMQTNPKFAQFVQENKNKSVEQICKENGVDYDAFKSAVGK